MYLFISFIPPFPIPSIPPLPPPLLSNLNFLFFYSYFWVFWKNKFFRDLFLVGERGLLLIVVVLM